jgi:predicted amidophosphoribosyltransferase
MPGVRSRMAREARTVEAMIALYCRERHVREQHGDGDALCSQCEELLDYARTRLDKCPYQESKTTCAKCPSHCYRPAPREQIRAVMRYAGPRMLYRHPLLALLHLFDGMRDEPVRPG